jgi:hypothetical protein
VLLQGVGRNNYPQKISLSVTEMDLGTTVVNRPKSDVFRVSNIGERRLNVLDITVADEVSESFKFSDTWLVIEPGKYKDVVVTYDPRRAETINTAIKISSNDPDNKIVSLNVNATCIDYTGPQLKLSTTQLSFGTLARNGRNERTFFVANLSESDTLKIDSLRVPTQFQANYLLTPSEFSVAPDDSQKVKIVFAPTNVQSYITTLTVYHNDEYPAEAAIALSGTGVLNTGNFALGQISGWNSGFTYPFSNVLSNGPDNAFFVKDFYLESFPESAKLSIAFSDSIDIFINGMLIKSNKSDTSFRWNISNLDINNYVLAGRNRIATVVHNLSGTGDFDCVLLINDDPIIKSGLYYPNDEAAKWTYYGSSGTISAVPVSFEGQQWYNYSFGWAGADSILTSFIFEPGSAASVVWGASSYGRHINLRDIAWKNGIVGQSLEFKGTSSSYAGFQSIIGGFPRTFQFWFNNYGQVAHAQTLFSSSTPEQTGRGLYIETDNVLWISTASGLFSSEYQIVPGRWYYVSLQYLADKIQLFINQKLVNTISVKVVLANY